MSRSHWQTLLKEHPDAIAAGVCAVLVLLGWLSLVGIGEASALAEASRNGNRGWLGVSLLI